MDIERARAFIRKNHRAVLHTNRGDGGPQMSPVTVGMDAEGMAVVSTRETAMKTKNLRRDDRASLCVMNDGFFGEWLQIDGRAQIVSLPEAMDHLVQYYRGISGEHPDWNEYREAMKKQRRVALRISIEKVRPHRRG